MQSAHRMFANTCAACHGADGRGGAGFPDLSDRDWLYGGDIETIQASILQGRTGMMPAFGRFLSNDEIKSLTQYVMSMSGNSARANKEDQDSVTAGKALYQRQCVACHNADGSGNTILGAANLNDDIWLHGGDERSIYRTIRFGKTNRMPPHKHLISEQQSRLLTAYVLNSQQQSDDTL